MKFGDNNSNTLGECMLKFVQNGACLHFGVQKVWGAHFFLDTLYMYRRAGIVIMMCPCVC